MLYYSLVYLPILNIEFNLLSLQSHKVTPFLGNCRIGREGVVTLPFYLPNTKSITLRFASSTLLNEGLMYIAVT